MHINLRTFLAVTLLLATAVSAQAMTEAQAARNLMYLVAARNEGSFCKQFDTRALVALLAWEQQNLATFEKSTKTIENHAVATKTVSKAEASEVSMLLMARLQQRDDLELAQKRTEVTCSKYTESLKLYESKLAR